MPQIHPSNNRRIWVGQPNPSVVRRNGGPGDEDAGRSWETHLAIIEAERAKPAPEADGPPIEPKDALPAAEAGGASTEAKDALPAPEAGGASTEVKAVKPAAEASCMPTFISHINATYQ